MMVPCVCFLFPRTLFSYHSFDFFLTDSSTACKIESPGQLGNPYTERGCCLMESIFSSIMPPSICVRGKPLTVAAKP